MENEEKTMQTPEEDYIAKITELKNSTVSKEDYDKLRADNKKLLDAIVTGQAQAEQPTVQEEKIDVKALRNELYNGRYEGTDLDYISKVLKLRKAIIDSGEPDPGVCNGVKTVASEADYENCNDVCDALQEMVDFADGDAAVFRSEMMRRVKFK